MAPQGRVLADLRNLLDQPDMEHIQHGNQICLAYGSELLRYISADLILNQIEYAALIESFSPMEYS